MAEQMTKSQLIEKIAGETEVAKKVVKDVLETLAHERAQADVVASGTVSEDVVALAESFTATVRSVLLVDPGHLELGTCGPRTPHDQLLTAGVWTWVVVRSAGGDRDRVEPPMPLASASAASPVPAPVAPWRATS